MPPGTNRAHAGPSVDCVRRPLVYPCTRGERLVVHFTTEYARQSMALLTAFRGPTPSHAHSPCGRIGTRIHPARCCRNTTDTAIVRSLLVLCYGSPKLCERRTPYVPTTARSTGRRWGA